MRPLPNVPFAYPRLDDATPAEVAARAMADASNPSHVLGVLRHLQGKGVRATKEQIRQALIERARRFEALGATEAPAGLVAAELGEQEQAS